MNRQTDVKAYTKCRLCPRECRVDRAAGITGFCSETATCRIGFAGPHFGEEPPFRGTRGSGTVFFSGCSSRCFFCQNHQISFEGIGRRTELAELLDTARKLIALGVHNLNFVTPDHFWPHVAHVCRALRDEDADIPFLLNTSGYQRLDMIREYAELIDIFVPDFKYAEPELARACMGDPLYPEIAMNALSQMVERKGFLLPWDPTGAVPAQTGVLVRHLVLPGRVENSIQAIKLLRREFGKKLPISVMSQFRPTPECAKRNMFARAVTDSEYRQVCDLAGELEFENVFAQPRGGAPDFFPDFLKPNPFAGQAAVPTTDKK